ncbi:MAG: condensation protein [Gammaproteobacteria bacterium]|nr:condensation protein [Gammaproteobacteria bacterium]
MSTTTCDQPWLPLTLAQLDFWEEFMLHPHRPLSTVAHCLTLQGAVDELALLRAIAQTAREADILSVRFHLAEPQLLPAQQCDPQRAPLPLWFDLRAESDPLAAAKRLMQADIDAQLTLIGNSLVEQWLICVDDCQYLWYLRGHHIILDGYAMVLIEQRCAQLYTYFLGKGAAGQPFHRFVDFIVEEQAYQQSQRYRDDQRYWRDYLAQVEALPVLRKDAGNYGDEGVHLECPLPATFGPLLAQLASRVSVGWPDLLVLLSGAYLYYHTPFLRHGNELSLWLPFMSRWGSVSAYLPALIVNILPLHITCAPQESLADYLLRSAQVLRRQRAHGRYRVEQIASDMGIGKGQRYFFSPLVNVLPFDEPMFDGCSVAREVLASGPGDGFNITYRGSSSAAELVLHLDVDAAMADLPTLVRHQQQLLDFLARALQPQALMQPLHQLLQAEG